MQDPGNHNADNQQNKKAHEIHGNPPFVAVVWNFC
jgi:hypothetical protein